MVVGGVLSVSISSLTVTCILIFSEDNLTVPRVREGCP